METTDLVLMKLDTARMALSEARTIQETKKILDISSAAEIYAKRQKLGEEAIGYATEIKLEALRQLGNMLKETERNVGAKGIVITGNKRVPVMDTTPTLEELGIDKKISSLSQKIAGLSDEEFETIKTATNIAKVFQEHIKAEQDKKNEELKNKKVDVISGKYNVIVIDPPWQMKKIIREVAPNQVGFDYPTMTIDEIKLFDLPAENDCHVFMWITQKYLPIGFDIFEEWGVKYVCTFTWHKNGGFQPFGLPQYNSEFVLYGRIGTPKFIDTKQFFTCFNANRTGHSKKPNEFYETIKRVTEGNRIDIFSRRDIDGFYNWGNENGDN